MKSPLLVAFAILCAPVFVCAQPLADKVPAEAMVYIGWQGAESMPPAYANSHLKGVIDASKFDALFGQFLPALVTQLSKNDPKATQTMQLVRSLGGPLWRHPSAIFFSGVDLKAEGGPRPELAVLCQAGNEADALLAQLKATLELVKAGGLPFPIKADKSGDIVIFAIGFDPAADVIAADAAKSLSSNPKFKVSLAQVQGDSIVCLYADIEQTVSLADAAAAAFARPGKPAPWPALRDALGLKAAKQLMVTGGFDGRNWSTRMFLASPPPRQGLATFLESPPISEQAFKIIPETAAAAGVERLDLSAMFDLIRNIVAGTNPKGGKDFDDGLAKANAALGIDLKKDLLDSFGNEWIYYTNPADNASLFLINRLSKPAEAERALNRIEEFCKAQLAKAAPGIAELKQDKVGELNIHQVRLPQGAFSWTVANGNFYIGLSGAAVADAAAKLPDKSILTNPDFLALRNKLAVTNSISVSFGDLRKTAPVIYSALLQLAELGLGAARQAGVQPPEGMLPPLEKVLEQLEPAASFTWVDDAGWHYKGISPFPGSTALSPNGSMSVAVGGSAAAIAVLLPALNAAKERANRIKCASNLRQIGQGAMLYYDSHKKYPPDVATLVKDCDLSAHVFVCPSGETALADGLRTVDEAAKWANEHCAYVYLGANMKLTDPADRILAYDKPDNHERDGINLLFNDGHVEWQRFDAAMKLIKAQQGN